MSYVARLIATISTIAAVALVSMKYQRNNDDKVSFATESQSIPSTPVTNSTSMQTIPSISQPHQQRPRSEHPGATRPPETEIRQRIPVPTEQAPKGSRAVREQSTFLRKQNAEVPNAFFQADGKEQLKAALVETHVNRCNEQGIRAVGRLPRSSSVTVYHFRGTSGKWNRFWLTTELLAPDRETNADGVWRCWGGDAYEISMESNDTKVAVDRIVDLGNGIHEVQIFVRRPGVYRLSIDVVMSYPQRPTSDMLFSTSRETLGKLLGRELPGYDLETNYNSANKAGYAGLQQKFCIRKRDPSTADGYEKDYQRNESDKYVGTKAVEGIFSGPMVVPPFNPSVPCNQPNRSEGSAPELTTTNISEAWLLSFRRDSLIKNRFAHRDMFRDGHWVRLTDGCDGLHCTGELNALGSGGWVWVSDHCTIHIYRSDASELMREVFSNEHIIGWGVSHLKQPLANLIEYKLRTPLFSAGFMDQLLDLAAQGKKRPWFGDYRKWKVTVSPPKTAKANGTKAATFQLVWGGCSKHGQTPDKCFSTIGLKFTGLIDKAIAQHFPTTLLFDHFTWRHPRYNEWEYLQLINTTLRKNIAELIAREIILRQQQGLNPSNPLMIWHTSPHYQHNKHNRACSEPCDLHMLRHFNWAMEDFMTEEFGGNVLLISRNAITAPLHFGDVFCHFGVHYGASLGMCYTGTVHKAEYRPEVCLRNTMADDMLAVLWMNAIAAYRPKLRSALDVVTNELH